MKVRPQSHFKKTAIFLFVTGWGFLAIGNVYAQTPIYKTPGVYTEETDIMPPAIAEVATAIPAFIGYTENATRHGASLKDVPTRIETLLEYEQWFGGPPVVLQSVTVQADNNKTTAYTIGEIAQAADTPLLYYSLRLYFDNGGGPCYIVSVGNYEAALNLDDFKTGLDVLKKEDEPTLIVMPDASRLSAADSYLASKAALGHSGEMKDRFAILDVKDNVDDFRNAVGISYMAYGAAYTPYLNTAIRYAYDEDEITISGLSASKAHTPTANKVNLADLNKKNIDGATNVNYNPSLHKQIKIALDAEHVTLPPSPAMAGIYARVDHNEGVWKAPANVDVASVFSLTKKITNDDQQLLNVDPVSGKSINAIRSFAGQGILVWGARTLAGNDNDWRYIPVQRMFMMIEESIREGTAWAVFEPNNTETWLKAKTSIENYLNDLWRRGALAGSNPRKAFFVSVGLGETMTQQDILEGRMIIEIGIAPLRPAEFIILKISQKMQN